MQTQVSTATTMYLLRTMLLLCYLYRHTNAWNQCNSTSSTLRCSNITVLWKCKSDSEQHNNLTQKICCDSLDSAINSILSEADECQGKLQVNLTLHSFSHKLSTNVTFTHAQFSKVILEATQDVQIICQPGHASLRFNGASNHNNTSRDLMEVHIRRITFKFCGPGNDNDIQAAIFLNNDCQVDIKDVHVRDSNGSGLALVNITGTITVNKSSFIRNTVMNGFGGGVHLTVTSTSSSKIEFTHSNFTKNKAAPFNYTLQGFEGHITRGGGMYVYYGKNSFKVPVHIENCVFCGNVAHWGSGLFCAFDDNASSNVLCVYHTKFIENTGELNYFKAASTVSGGGAAIAIYNATSNTVHISNCAFIHNKALWGGGLIFYSKTESLQGNPQNGRNQLNMSHCIFKHNVAHTGAAIHIYCSSPASSPQECNASPVLANSKFIHNGNLSHIWFNHQISDSVVSIAHFPTVLNGTLMFMYNHGSPLHIHETSVTVNESSVIKFQDNTAQNGGGISLYGAWIAVSQNSLFEFTNNVALDQGGAIYSYMTQEAYLPYSYQCFIRYIKEVTPCQWNANFTFHNNTAFLKSETIYATSIFPCIWPTSHTSSLDHDIRSTFCTWKNWNLGKNCTNQIHTAARNFSSTMKNISVFPGIPSLHFVSTVDDLGHNLSDFAIYPTVLHSQNVQAQVDNNSLTVYGDTNTTVEILLKLEGDRPLFMTVNVSLQSCPPGFWFSSTTLSCICNLSLHFYCEYKPDLHWIAYIATGWCMSYSDLEKSIDSKMYVVYGRCPFTSGYHTTTNRYVHLPYLPLPLQKEELNDKFCGVLNRKGILCGECAENYSIDILSDTFDCQNITSSNKDWIIYGFLDGFLPLIFFVIVLLLHISFTSGPVNGFIFFSQVLTVTLEVIVIRSSWLESTAEHSNQISNVIVRLYSVWSLDFFRLVPLFDDDYVICVGSHFKVMHVLVLRYLSALYPLCFLLIAFIVIELHARNCRVLVWLWKPVCFLCTRLRQAWKAQTSIVDAFAAFILLSYVKIVRISLLLITYSSILIEGSSIELKVVNYDPTVRYLNSEHAPFWCIGVFCFFTFGLMPPLFLTLYQFKFFQRFLNRCKINRSGLRIFMDAYQGCYKDGKNGGPDRRYFGGLYFIFRLVVFMIFDTTTTLSPTYILLLLAFIVFGMITAIIQPYKNPFFTYVDIFFFNLLAIIMALQYYTVFILDSYAYLPTYLLYLTFSLIIIPTIYAVLFVFYWLCRQAPQCVKSNIICLFKTPLRLFKSKKKSNNNRDDIITSTYSIGSSIQGVPDRLEHSFRYRSLQIQSIVPFEND